MPAKTSQPGSGGFSAAERAAMKQRAAELRAEGKKGAKKADELQAVLDSIASMTPEDRAVAERVHAAVSAVAPELSPRTWYGMPAYANAEGKIVVCFKNSGKFNTRYSTLEFQDAANLDDGDIWPVSFALHEWSPAVERKVAELMKAAVSLPPPQPARGAHGTRSCPRQMSALVTSVGLLIKQFAFVRTLCTGRLCRRLGTRYGERLSTIARRQIGDIRVDHAKLLSFTPSISAILYLCPRAGSEYRSAQRSGERAVLRTTNLFAKPCTLLSSDGWSCSSKQNLAQ